MVNIKAEHCSSKDLLFESQLYNVLEWESKWYLRLNASKNTDYIKTCFKQKIFKIKPPTKKLNGSMSLYPTRMELGGLQRFAIFQVL